MVAAVSDLEVSVQVVSRLTDDCRHRFRRLVPDQTRRPQSPNLVLEEMNRIVVDRVLETDRRIREFLKQGKLLRRQEATNEKRQCLNFTPLSVLLVLEVPELNLPATRELEARDEFRKPGKECKCD